MRRHQKPPAFMPGMTYLPTSHMNQMLDAVPAQIVGSHGIAIKEFGDRLTIQNPQLENRGTNQLQSFYVVQEFDDVLLCLPMGAIQQPQYINQFPATVRNLARNQFTPVYVTKPYLLQMSPWNGQFVRIKGVDVFYEYTSLAQRTEVYSTGKIKYTTIDTPYFEGDVILAAQNAQTGYYYSSGGSLAPVMWQDMNTAAREWEGAESSFVISGSGISGFSGTSGTSGTSNCIACVNGVTPATWGLIISNFTGPCAVFNGGWTCSFMGQQANRCWWFFTNGTVTISMFLYNDGSLIALLSSSGISIEYEVTGVTNCCKPVNLQTAPGFCPSGCACPTSILATPSCVDSGSGSSGLPSLCCPSGSVAPNLTATIQIISGSCSAWNMKTLPVSFNLSNWKGSLTIGACRLDVLLYCDSGTLKWKCGASWSNVAGPPSTVVAEGTLQPGWACGPPTSFFAFNGFVFGLGGGGGATPPSSCSCSDPTTMNIVLTG